MTTETCFKKKDGRSLCTELPLPQGPNTGVRDPDQVSCSWCAALLAQWRIKTKAPVVGARATHFLVQFPDERHLSYACGFNIGGRGSESRPDVTCEWCLEVDEASAAAARRAGLLGPSSDPKLDPGPGPVPEPGALSTRATIEWARRRLREAVAGDSTPDFEYMTRILVSLEDCYALLSQVLVGKDMDALRAQIRARLPPDSSS